MSKIEEQVINKIRSRADAGKAKYGVTMERTDLTNAEWLQHLQEELMDAAVYVEKLLTLIDAYEEGLVKCPIPLSEWPNSANWAAMDPSGVWYLYKFKPKIDNDILIWDKKRNFFYVWHYRDSDFPWHETLTHRSELENQKQ